MRATLRRFSSSSGRATLAFDMYGTTFDVKGLGSMMRAIPAIDAKEPAFNSMWRAKQLEYTFRRTCMDAYRPMTVATREALDFCCEMFDAELSEEERERLCGAYLLLPAFADCKPGLDQLAAANHRCYAFSNGTSSDVRCLLANAELSGSFVDTVVVDDMPSPVFKPHAATYAYLMERAGSSEEDTWLVSSNPFDILGAAACGWRTAWMKRGERPNYVMDPWADSPGPTVVVSSFLELADAVASHPPRGA